VSVWVRYSLVIIRVIAAWQEVTLSPVMGCLSINPVFPGFQDGCERIGEDGSGQRTQIKNEGWKAFILLSVNSEFFSKSRF
jgi:hypothetical protein